MKAFGLKKHTTKTTGGQDYLNMEVVKIIQDTGKGHDIVPETFHEEIYIRYLDNKQ